MVHSAIFLQLLVQVLIGPKQIACSGIIQFHSYTAYPRFKFCCKSASLDACLVAFELGSALPEAVSKHSALASRNHIEIGSC